MATITGQKRFLEIDTIAESTPGIQNGDSAENREYAELISGGFQLNESPQFDDIAIEANLDSQPAPQTAGYAPEGTVELVAAPFGGGVPDAQKSWTRFMLDWALKRTSGAIRSHSLTQWNPISGAGFGRLFTGCKCDTLSLNWSNTDRLKNPVLGIKGLFPQKSADSVPSSPTFPTYRHWNFTYIGAQLAGSVFTTYTGSTTFDKTLRNINIEVANGITAGAPGYKYNSGSLVTGISELDESDLAITGSFEIALANATAFFDPMLAGTHGQIRLMGFHPSASKTTLNQSAGFSTANGDDGGAASVQINVTDASIFSVGNVVYIEDASASDPANWIREVLYVSAVNESANMITLNLNGNASLGIANDESIGRGQTFTDGSYIYNLGIQFLIRDFTITGWEPVGGATDKVYQRVTFRAGIYTGSHPTGGANYNHQALGFLVQ